MSTANTAIIIRQNGHPVGVVDLFPYIAHSLTESTLKMYQRDVAAYLDYAQREELAPLEPTTLAAFRDHMIFHSPKSPLTINRMLSAVRRIMQEAFARQLIDSNAAYAFEHMGGASVTRLKDRMRHSKSIPISKQQMQLLCSQPDTSTLVGLRDRALLLTLATSGVRASECGGLLVDRVYHKEGGYIIQVMGKKDIEYRDANLSPVAYDAIQAWLSARANAVRGIVSQYAFTQFSDFGETPNASPMTAKIIWVAVKGYATSMGLGHISPHSFRRFVAQSLAPIDLNMARISLGHRSVATTQMYLLNQLTIGITDGVI